MVHQSSGLEMFLDQLQVQAKDPFTPKTALTSTNKQFTTSTFHAYSKIDLFNTKCANINNLSIHLNGCDVTSIKNKHKYNKG